ncbi:putative non-specific serine/threonine protein kinase [Rosa chinensis]|uniref:Putative non-specific serine/threonine protein kinase n=1 Tax=Rosa chinensis TaxID=74649 RepID=A0A2P6Q8Y2_ROSCH|nr:putative non-specific serine/threonine protein kinase [Rosa chinensis]
MLAALQGFVPKSPNDWNAGNWSNGCVRKTNYLQLKLPDTSSSWFDTSMSLEECKVLCLENCSCTAYANTDIRDGGSGCLLWFENLIDIKEFTPGGGQDLYIRMAASELGSFSNSLGLIFSQ